jgi:hypothetical protein
MTACSTATVSRSGIACDVLAADTSRAPLDRKASPTAIVLPTLGDGRPSGEVTAWMFVNRRGKVDSVRLEGTIPEHHHPEIRRAMSVMRYRPAERDGCPVASWADSLVFTFPGRR